MGHESLTNIPGDNQHGCIPTDPFIRVALEENEERGTSRIPACKKKHFSFSFSSFPVGADHLQTEAVTTGSISMQRGSIRRQQIFVRCFSETGKQ
jgi:hypothetical protein